MDFIYLILGIVAFWYVIVCTYGLYASYKEGSVLLYVYLAFLIVLLFFGNFNSYLYFTILGFLVIWPFYQAKRERCPHCYSVSIDNINEKLLSKELHSRQKRVKVGENQSGQDIYREEKEYYEEMIYELAYNCQMCQNTWESKKYEERTI